jgi:hypothetical protein
MKPYVQAGLVLCQGYVTAKHHTSQIQNSHLKQCVPQWDSQLHPLLCMTVPQVDIRICREYFLYIQYTIQNAYIYIQYIYL